MSYGVVPTGFSRKPLAVILAEIEAQVITEFGPDAIQTPQSPLGQINGLFADLLTEFWEIAEDVYQSYDPAQAEGARLDALGNLRLIKRAPNETDAGYRQAITNEGTARITYADFIRALRGLSGVSFAQIFVNETSQIDINNMSPNTVAAAVLGGDDNEIADLLNRYVVPGIAMHGNYFINTEIDGYCRTVRFIRPVEVEVELRIQVRLSQARQNCPAPSPVAVATSLFAYMTDPDTRPQNGQHIDAFFVRQFIESQFEGVEYVSLIALKADDEIEQGRAFFNFFEIAKVTDVTIEPV